MHVEALCSTLKTSLPPLFECDKAPREGVRIRTPMMYPDGGVIDVYVLQQDAHYIVTDFGETLGWLDLQTANAERSEKQNRIIADACETFDITLVRGQLMRKIEKTEVLGEAVITISKASQHITRLSIS